MAPNETVSRPWQLKGPVPGDATLLLGNFDLAESGYLREEYFLSGTATSYRRGAERVEPAETADYATRIVVCRPNDPARLSGTVVVEWFNVSGGGDGSPDWAFLHRQIVRSGATYVGVSAQQVGIEGGGILGNGVGLQGTDPARYGSLHHPGDAYAYDIYSHAAEAVRDPGSGILDGADARRVIAVGESQSAAFIVTYVNDVDPLARAFDAFLVHGRAAGGGGLDGGGLARRRASFADDEAATGGLSDLRRLLPQEGEPILDARVPVITVQSETDVHMGGIHARCADGARTRLWEIAGAAHFDTYGLIGAHDDDGRLSPQRFAEVTAATDQPLGLQSAEPVNSGLQQHYVLQAALAHLERWADEGTPAPSAPLLATDPEGEFERDDNGNVQGGVRTPWVDVPTAVLSGLGATGGGFTMLFGVTRPFDAATLSSLYPGGRDEYLRQFAAAAEAARQAGFLLDDDMAEILAVAGARFPA